jgi:hypothetical protein
LQPERAGSVRLWIKIDNQNAMTYFSQRRTEIYSRCGFAHTAFLISDRDDLHKSE